MSEDILLKKYGGVITGLRDLTGDAAPSKIFCILASCLSYLLDLNPEIAVPQSGIAWRKRIHFAVRKMSALTMRSPQIFENRNFLKAIDRKSVMLDPGIVLPSEPVIWLPNHRFRDDVAVSLLAVQRHAYILWGSLPAFYNTFRGAASWLNGVILVNRKVSASTHSSIAKCIRAMSLGTDLLIYSEGGWNKSPNTLILDLWPGIYRIACETGAKVVPIVHYIRDTNNELKDNPIHTVVDDPIRIDDLPERAALEYLRDVLATWYYLMMEVYGQSTRAAELTGFASSTEAWEEHLKKRVKTADRYDTEIETRADYRPKWKVEPQQVWQAVADIERPTRENILDVQYAQKLIEDQERNYFQRRF